MPMRAAVCVGVNRAGFMTPLQAAARGAQDFERWAKDQGCDTTLLIDAAPKRVNVADIFNVIEQIVNSGKYGQLIVYFSGHGILSAPGTEYWLLSRAPQNPNEAVNLSRSVIEARNSGIPHVVFISDACRSSVTGPPLSGVMGSVIFPSRPIAPKQGEVDVYYATRPGDPAYEVPEAQATEGYRAIFTDALLKTVIAPPFALVETVEIDNRNASVITSRKMKDHLEATVPIDAADISVKLRQAPQVIVETALPKYFAEVKVQSIRTMRGRRPASPPALSVDRALSALKKEELIEKQGVTSEADVALAKDIGLIQELEGILAAHGRGHFETTTGFTIYGVGRVEAYAGSWNADPPFREHGDAWHLRLNNPPSQNLNEPSTSVFSFDAQSGAALAILPGFIGTVVVENGRVISVSYVPSDQTERYRESERQEAKLRQMRAFAAVASRNGRFEVPSNPDRFAEQIRQFKGIDPTMGVYAAYAYAQAGRFRDVYRVYTYMWADQIEVPRYDGSGRNDYVRLPIPFDVCMLAGQYTSRATEKGLLPIERSAPFCPMFAQGWALLDETDPMFRPIHRKLRPHLIPSLWTTFSPEGVQVAREAINLGRV
jgi:Caspase domain